MVLGRIDVEGFAGGMLKLEPKRSETAVDGGVGAALALSTEHAAHGIAEIVDENMANAARVHSVERGVVIAEHTLVAFGGAAPLHACRLAEKLGIQRIVIPEGAGVGSAIGFLRAPAAFELVRSRFMFLDAMDFDAANALLDTMSREARALAEPAALGRPLAEQWHAYMRYTGQGHEIALELPLGKLAAPDTARLREAFEADYRRLFERHIPGARIEILSWSVLATTAAEVPKKLAARKSSAVAAKATGSRLAWDQAEDEFVKIDTYARAGLKTGQRLQGPAFILESGTSTYVSLAFEASLDAGGAIVLERRKTAVKG